jgi:geranylgeranyl pyrophosphate synthase
MDKYGSIDYARTRAKRFAKQSRQYFEEIGFFIDSDARENLKMGINFILNRDF